MMPRPLMGGNWKLKSASKPSLVELESPLKCLNNLTDPSPTKNLPTLLRNPFNKPTSVKRRLTLSMTSPRKQIPNSASSSCTNSPAPGASNLANNVASCSSQQLFLSPSKKTSRRVFQCDDEDANLEPPKMRSSFSPEKKKHRSSDRSCYTNDWTLKTKMRVNFSHQCRNWDHNSTSTHKRHNGTKPFEETPSKYNDKTISVEAIKNAATYYQHPYLSWLPLFPRTINGFDCKNKSASIFTLSKHADISHMMQRDWCESLDDLTNLLLDGKCPFFYICSDIYNMLVRYTPGGQGTTGSVQVAISPFSYGMGSELSKNNIEFRFPGELDKCKPSIRSFSTPTKLISNREDSRASFGSSQSKQTINLIDDASSSQQSSPQRASSSNIKATSSIDSGNASDLDEDEYYGEDENNADTDEILESLGLSQQEFPSLQSKRKGFITTDSNTTTTKSTSNKPLAFVDGVENVRKFMNFLKTNRLYTISTVGKFACIPPTLLSPCEFRLSTPQCPEVVLSKNMIEQKQSRKPISPAKSSRNNNNNELHQTKHLETVVDSQFSTPKKQHHPQQQRQQQYNSAVIIGPNFVELKGTILPSSYKKVHRLLSVSDNMAHNCTSTLLESSAPLGNVSHPIL